MPYLSGCYEEDYEQRKPQHEVSDDSYKDEGLWARMIEDQVELGAQ